jgi:predicted permease
MPNLVHEIRLAIRSLSTSRGFAVTCILTLAVALGANAAMFALLQSVVLRPLTFPQSERLIVVAQSVPSLGLEDELLSADDLRELREHSQLLEHVVGVTPWDANLTGAGEPVRVRASAASAGLFALLRAPLLMGREFTEQDAREGHRDVVVISESLWRSRFASDPRVLGSRLQLNGSGWTVVGVARTEASYPLATDVWRPLEERPAPGTPGRDVQVLGRLRPDSSAAAVDAELGALAEALRARSVNTPERSLRTVPLSDWHNGPANRVWMGLLMAAAVALLLVACANLANLTLARHARRRHELAVRAALGASRLQLARQLLCEVLLLTLVGAALGVLLSGWLVNAIVAALPSEALRTVPGLARIGIDRHVLLFTLGVSFAASLVIGLLPALWASRPGLLEALKAEGGTLSAAGSRTRSVLVAAQLAFSLALLSASVLIGQSAGQLMQHGMSVRTEEIITARLEPSPLRLEGAARRPYVEEVLANLEARTGAKAAIVTFTPFERGCCTLRASAEGSAIDPAEAPYGLVRSGTGPFLDILGLRLLGGRTLAATDGEGALPVAVVSRAFAQQLWPGEDALGKRFRLEDSPETWRTVVGVMADVFPARPMNEVYLPLAQEPRALASLSLVVRSGGPSSVDSVRAALRELDANLPPPRVGTLADAEAEVGSGSRLVTRLMALYAVLAALLAGLGVYGVNAFASAQRARELGIRSALGARRRDLLALMVRGSSVTILVGLSIGLALALAMAKLMSHRLEGVVALDLRMIAAAAGFLALVAALGSLLPARRASAADPMTALRRE